MFSRVMSASQLNVPVEEGRTGTMLNVEKVVHEQVPTFVRQ